MTRFTTALGAAMAAACALSLVPTAGAIANTSQPVPAAHRTDRIAEGAPTRSGSRTWHVLVGGQSKDRAVQAEGYYPHIITIDAGDTIVWTLNTTEIHAVAFAGTCEELSCIPPDCFTVNIDASPCGPPAYDGVTAWDSSGRMLPPGYNWDSSVPHGSTSYSLTFTRPGVNIYFDLSYAGMRGVVIVNPAETPYPLTPAQYSAQGRQQLKADLAAGARARAGGSHVTTSANPGGTSTYHVAVGASAPQRAKAVLRSAPVSAADGTAVLDGSGIGASTNPAINVKIRLSGLAPGSVHAVQILPGVCGARAPTSGIIFSQLFVPPTFTLNSVTAGPDGTAAGTTAITAPPNYNGPGQLRIPSAGWFVNVAAGPVPDNGVTSAACGNVIFRAATVMRYFPQDVRVHVGDTVVWTNDTSEVHGVTFLAGQPLPQIPEWYSSSPIGNGVNYDGSSFVNSGPLYAADAGRNHSLALTFTKPGTFHYVDVGDFLLGMQGNVSVRRPKRSSRTW
jgi:plastocyanin